MIRPTKPNMVLGAKKSTSQAIYIIRRISEFELPGQKPGQPDCPKILDMWHYDVYENLWESDVRDFREVEIILPRLPENSDILTSRLTGKSRYPDVQEIWKNMFSL